MGKYVEMAELEIISDRGRILVHLDEEEYIGKDVRLEVVEFVKLAWVERVAPLYKERSEISDRTSRMKIYRKIGNEVENIKIEASKLQVELEE